MITQQRLKELLTYNPETGSFFWCYSRPRARKGTEAGYYHPSGYMMIKLDGKSYYVQRLVWLYTYGCWPSKTIDHINGVSTDNRLANLREASLVENCRNRGKTVLNTSGHKGVHWNKRMRKYQVSLSELGKKLYVGTFEDYNAAVAAYNTFVLNRYGSFANTGERV